MLGPTVVAVAEMAPAPPGLDWQQTQLQLNHRRLTVTAPVTETLSRTLRCRVGLTSVRETCGVGVCGTCTVLLDGSAASSCLALTAQLAGVAVTTAEGLLGPDGEPGPVQRAFIRRGAYQCGFCIPAMTLAVHAALYVRRHRDREAVVDELSGNLCRCGSYPQIREVLMELLADRGGEAADGATTGGR